LFFRKSKTENFKKIQGNKKERGHERTEKMSNKKKLMLIVHQQNSPQSNCLCVRARVTIQLTYTTSVPKKTLQVSLWCK
jgi:hypothetical protein